MDVKSNFYITLLFVVFLVYGCEKQSSPNLPSERVRAFANVLYNRELYQQAIAEYERYLHQYPINELEQANISYTIANIYFDRVRDYQSALAYYLRVKDLYEENDLTDDAGRRIVECLERLQRSADAQQALEESTFIDKAQIKKKRAGAIIAKIGNREITTGDLEFEIKNLPPYMLAQIQDRNKKVEFLKQYIATELLYETAKRKGLEQNNDIIQAAFQARKNLIVQKLLQQEVAEKVDFEDSDLQLYFKANKASYTKTDSSGIMIEPDFNKNKGQVAQDYVRQKQQEAYDRLIERMMRAEAVQIFEDKIE